MTGHARLVYDPELTAYDFGPHHPLAPIRVRLTVALATELGLVDTTSPTSPTSPTEANGRVVQVPAPSATDELLALVHDPAYIEAVGWPVSTPTG